MEEMKNNEVIEETMDEVEVIDLYPEEDGDDSGSGIGKLVIAGLGIAAATVGVLAVKNKEKIKQKRLDRMKKKLEANGYGVEDPIIAEDYDEDDFLEEEVDPVEESEE